MAFRQAGKLSIHKKTHKNIIFKVTKIDRRLLTNKIVSVLSDIKCGSD